MTNPRLLGPALVALAYSSTLQAQEKDICQDIFNRWPLPYLARLTKLVDGYQGWSKHLRDGKLSLTELADYRYNIRCKSYLGNFLEECAGPEIPVQPRGAVDDLGDTVHQRFAEVAGAYVIRNAISLEEERLKPFDANHDSYLTPEDDLDGDGFITCADAKKYVPPVKAIKPTKTQPPPPPRTPRRR